MASGNEHENVIRMMTDFRNAGLTLPRVRPKVGDRVTLKDGGKSGVITSDWDSSPEARSSGRYGLDKWFIRSGTNTHVLYRGDFVLNISDSTYIARYVKEN